MEYEDDEIQLLVTNVHGVVVCNRHLDGRLCDTGNVSCVACEYFRAIIDRLWDIESLDQLPHDLLKFKPQHGPVCAIRDKCNLTCQKCRHFQKLRQKLFNFDGDSAMRGLRHVEQHQHMIQRYTLQWYPAWKPPRDNKPKLLHVWGCPDVQFVHAFYLPDVKGWSWPSIRGIDNDELAPVAWADLPVIPSDILDAYTEDTHFKKTKTRRK